MILVNVLMGPIRGLKRRKKAEKKVDQNVLAAAAASDGDGDGDADADSLVAQPQPLDWWDNFSRRISGNITFSLQCVYVMHSMYIFICFDILLIDFGSVHCFVSCWVCSFRVSFQSI